MNLLSENSCNRQNSVYPGYPQHCEQTAYGINHTKFCCVCKHLWSLSFSKLPHSLRLCCILKKPLDHKCLHTSIVQYYLTSQLWCLNNSQEPCEWVNADLRVLCIESEQIMHLKVGCPNFGPVRGSAILPCMCQPLCIGRVNCLCPDLVLTLCDTSFISLSWLSSFTKQERWRLLYLVDSN